MECRNCTYRKSCKRQCMDLPNGKTCGDCRNYEKCRMLCGSRIKSENTQCDFEPTRFKERMTVEENVLPEHYKQSLYNAFTGGKG